MKLNILYISKYVLTPGRGSAGSRGFFLMNQLAEQGHAVTVVTSDSNHLIAAPVLSSQYLCERIDALDVFWLRTYKYKSPKSAARIVSWLHFEWLLLFFPWRKLRRPDVIIVSSLSLLTILNGLVLRYLFRCVLVFEVRDIWPLTLTEEGGYKFYNPLILVMALVEYLGYRFSDVIVGTMPNLGPHVKDILGFRKPVSCIPMGVTTLPLSESVPLPSDYKAAYLSSDNFVVAHVGTIGATNALETFFECADAMQGYRDISFLLIGSGDLRDSFRSKYRHLHNIKFAPPIPKELVQEALAHCDLLYFSVYPSRVWEYGQSLNKLIDYMLSGKPIVASYSGYRSMINEAGCGSFVPAGNVLDLKNEILRFYCMSPTERREIGTRGRLWLLEHRSYKKLAADYLEIILKALPGSRCDN